MKCAGNSFVTRLSDTPPKTIDLPAVAGTPAELSCQDAMTALINVNIAADFYWTNAESAAVGLSRLGSDTTRGKFPAGYWQFEISGNHKTNLY